MALPPLATIPALAAWVGQTISGDDARAEAVLSAASAIVRGFTGQTWTDDADELTDVPDDVSAVTVQVAARVYLSPPNANVKDWTQGPFREGYFDSATLGLYLTDSEKEALSGYIEGVPTLGIGSISITTGVRADHTIYVPTGPPPSGYPFPWYPTDDLP